MILAVIALIVSSVSLTISYLTYKSNRYELHVGKRVNISTSSYSILFWITNSGKRPVTVMGYYATFAGTTQALCADDPEGFDSFNSLNIRLEEADMKEVTIWETDWRGDYEHDVWQPLYLKDVRVTVIDACGKRYVAKSSSGTRYLVKDPSDAWQRRFPRSVLRLTSQLRDLLRINTG